MNFTVLDEIIYRFTNSDGFRQTCAGVQIFDGMGSGKISSSGVELAQVYLRACSSFLAQSTKKDEQAR